MLRPLILIILTLAALLFSTKPAASQSVIEVTQNEAVQDFPSGISFHLSVKSSQTIESVYLRYGSNALSCQSGSARQKPKFTPADQVDITWDWEFKRSGTLPPGSEVWWQWEITDAAGNTLQTEVQTAVVEDRRHTWKQLSRDGVNIQYYSGRQALGSSLLDISVQSLDRLEQELGLRPDGEVWITVYPSFDEVRAALVYSYDWTGGVAFSEYNAVIIGLPDENLNWAGEVIPHELAHLVTGRLIFNCKGITLPTWLSEGLAVFAEGSLDRPARRPVLDALEKGVLPRFTTLQSGFSAYSESASLSYLQSGVFVEYLIQEYGQEKMSRLLAVMQSGLKINDALRQVYGMDTEELDSEWRASLGFDSPLSAAQTPTGIRPTQTSVPTLALWTPLVQASPIPSLSPTPAPSLTPVTAIPATPVQTTSTPTPETSSPEDPDNSPGFLPVILIAAGGLSLVAAFAIALTRSKRNRRS